MKNKSLLDDSPKSRVLPQIWVCNEEHCNICIFLNTINVTYVTKAAQYKQNFTNMENY